MKTIAPLAAALLIFANAAHAEQSEYLVGLSGAVTGPGASTVAGAIEGLRLYIEKLNRDGGINGRKVKLIITDDRAEASRAAANTQRLLQQDSVSLLINSSLSSTYAPMMAEARRSGVPLLFAGSVCPSEVFPPAQDFLYCSTSFSAQQDARAAVDHILAKAGKGTSVGLAAMGIPVSRAGIDAAEKFATEAGLQSVSKQVIPPPTADYTPFATNLMQSNPTWIYSWAPWVAEVKTFEALRRLGWKGNYLTNTLPETEGELKRLEDKQLYAASVNAMFVDDLPIQHEMAQAAKLLGSTYPADQMSDGWLGGMVIEAVLAKTDWPATPEKIAKAMSTLKLDTKGLRGGPLVWTPDNHFRTQQHYRVYHWDTENARVKIAQDWVTYDVK